MTMGEGLWKRSLLEGRILMLAGVGPGLGAQIAQAAVAAGAGLVLASRNEANLASLAEQLRTAGGSVATAVCDVTSDDDCRRAVAVAEEAFGGIDALVCNAFAQGKAYGKPIEDADIDEWRAAFDVNVFGSLRMVKATIPAMKRRGGGAVVFIGSQITRRVFVGRGPYAASKAALLTAAQVLAKEVGPYNIRVNTVVPGRMWGPPLRGHLERLGAKKGTSLQAEVDRMTADVALPRLSTDEESARVVIFLASELSAGMTGQSVDVNAGETFH